MINLKIKKIIFAGVILVCNIYILQGQWNKIPITEKIYTYTALPEFIDINGDGLADIIGIDQRTSTLFWQEFKDGEFLPPKDIGRSNYSDKMLTSTTGKNPFKVADLDKDGDVDIVFKLFYSHNNLAWLEYINDGTDTYEVKEIVLDPLSNRIELLELIDINNDSELDIIMRFQSEDVIHVFEKNSKEIKLFTSIPYDRSWEVKTLDWDFDSMDELVLTNPNGKIKILKFNESELKLLAEYSPILDDLESIQYQSFIDYDNDGDFDILREIQIKTLVTDSSSTEGSKPIFDYSRQLQVIKNKEGDFILESFYETSIAYEARFESSMNIIGDIDNDEKFEWISGLIKETSLANDTLYSSKMFALNEQYDFQLQDSFNTALPILTSFRGAYIHPNYTEEKVAINGIFLTQNYNYRILQTNKFINQNQISTASWVNCVSCQPINDIKTNYIEVDIDLDGDKDLLTASHDNGYKIALLENNGSCVYSPKLLELTNKTYDSLAYLQISTAYIDNDENSDLVISECYSDHSIIKIAINKTNGSLVTDNSLSVEGFINYLYTKDLNNDGIPEIITTSHDFYPWLVDPRHEYLKIYEITENRINLKQEIRYSQAIGEIGFGDIDEDGDLDIILNSSIIYDGKISILLNEDHRYVFKESVLLENSLVNSLELIDIDGDSYPELVTNEDVLGDEVLKYYKFKYGSIDLNSAQFIYRSSNDFTFKRLAQNEAEVNFLIIEESSSWKKFDLGIINLKGNYTQLETSVNSAQVIQSDNNDNILVGKDRLILLTQNPICEDNTVSNSEKLDIESFKIYPNPTAGIINIQSKSELIVDLYSLDGKLISRHKTNGGHINIRHVKSGVYLLKIFEGLKTHYQELVIKI